MRQQTSIHSKKESYGRLDVTTTCVTVAARRLQNGRGEGYRFGDVIMVGYTHPQTNEQEVEMEVRGFTGQLIIGTNTEWLFREISMLEDGSMVRLNIEFGKFTIQCQ